jgi:hypothetical protein
MILAGAYDESPTQASIFAVPPEEVYDSMYCRSVQCG